MCAKSLGQWILNHFVTLYVESQWLTMRGHVVPMFVINFYYQMRCMMKLVITKKKRSLTTLFMMCSMTRSSWCAPHQNSKERTIVMHRILNLSHNASNTPGHISSSVRRQTKKVNIPIITKYCQEIRTILNRTSLIADGTLVAPIHASWRWCDVLPHSHRYTSQDMMCFSG
jgi:hypothetical protein